MKMNKTLTALIAGASLGLSGQALAAGTTAGTPIANSVTLSYSVGNVSQDNETANVSFDVDNKVDFSVEQKETTTIPVVPNGPSAGLTYSIKFEVSNNGNSGQDFALSATDAGAVTVSVSDLANSVASVTDNVDTGVTFKVYVEEGTTTSTYDALDTETHINSLNPDAKVFVWVVIDDASKIDSSLVDGSIAAVALTATVHDDGGDAHLALGSITTSDDIVAFDKDNVQVVFADTDSNGYETDNAAFEIATAKLVVTKTVRVLSDMICNNGYKDFATDSCTTATYQPKAIPGARVEFTISVNNTGSIASDAYTITDDLTAVAATGIKLDDALGSPVEITDNAGATGTVTVSNGSYGNISIEDIPSLAAGATEEIKITAYID